MSLEYVVTQQEQDTFCITEAVAQNNTYCYLLVGSESSLLVDTGNGFGDLRTLVAQYTSTPVMVANTHGHLDHIGRNHQFDTIWMHERDFPVYAEHASPAFRRMFFAPILEMAQIKLDGEQETALYELPFAQPQPLREGQVLNLGNRRLTVVETPGHSPGSVCFLEAERNQIFTGDSLCDQGVLLSLPHSCTVQCLYESLLKLQAVMEPFAELAIYPGHHTVPLPTDYLGRYLRLCQAVLAGELVGTASESAGEQCLMALQEGVALAYYENKRSD